MWSRRYRREVLFGALALCETDAFSAFPRLRGVLRVQDIEVWEMESLAGAVHDLDGGGVPSSCCGKASPPISVRGSRRHGRQSSASTARGWWSEAPCSLQFYDAEVLPRLEHHLTVEDPEKPYRKDILTIERDKILRVLGRSRAAGLPAALARARSADSVRRIFASPSSPTLADRWQPAHSEG